MVSPRKPKAPVRPRKPGPLLKPKQSKKAVASQTWLDTLKIWQKLLLVAGGFAIPLVLVVGLLVNNQNQQINFSVKEQIGTFYLHPVVDLLENTQKHRGLVNQWLRGNDTVKPQIDTVRKTLRDNLRSLREQDARYGSILKTTETVDTLEERLNSILQFDRNVSPETSWDFHSRFIQDQLINLILLVGNTSNLILDPDLDTYWVMNNAVVTLPKLAEALGQTRGYGTGILTSRSATSEQLLTLAGYKGNITQLTKEAEEAVSFALSANLSLGTTVNSAFNSIAGPIAEFTRVTDMYFLRSKVADIPAGDYFAIGTAALDKTYALFRISLQELNRLLELRIQKFQRQQLIQLLALAVALAITFLLVGTIIQRITRPINQLYRASQALSRGYLQVRVAVESSDELGSLAETFNESINQLRIKAEADALEMQRNTQLQTNISQFLNVATEIAQGDFTKRGAVTEDVLGNVVDAINLMTEEMAFLLKDVQKAALSVNQSAEQMNSLTDSIASGAQVQADEVIEVRERTQQAAAAIRQMAERASGSVKQARQTLEAARAGRSAVSATLSGMTDIRIEIQGIADQVRQLSKRSSEIETIAKTLEDFASQTNLLALNASFEAAGAGTLGRRFAVIADEIRSLAESSARETSRVGLLVQEVQNDINGVVAMAQDGVRQVESGYEVANTAGERLEEISKLAEQAAQVAEQISVLAQSQVSEVERVDKAVQNIAQTTSSTRQESLQGRKAAQDMRQLAETLSSNLSRFRLPS